MIERKDKLFDRKFIEAFSLMNHTKSYVARAIGTYNHVISGVIKRERYITTHHFAAFVKEFKVNPMWVFDMSEQVFLGNSIFNTLDEREILDKMERIAPLAEKSPRLASTMNELAERLEKKWNLNE